MASRSVNKVILVGHLGKDAETKFTPAGVSVTKFSVATNRRWKDQQTGEWKEETDWANVVLWRQENLANYLTKGKQVYVEGRLQTRSYDDKDGKKQYMTEVVADDVILLGGRGGDGGGGMQESSGPQPVSMPRSAQKPQGGRGAGRGSGDHGRRRSVLSGLKAAQFLAGESPAAGSWLVACVAMAYAWRATETREQRRINVAPDPDRGRAQHAARNASEPRKPRKCQPCGHAGRAWCRVVPPSL